MLEVSKLNIHYGDERVVSDLSFTLKNNEIITLVGPTGCGKTTILMALAGLLPISKGKISTPKWVSDGNNHVPTEKRNIGMVFQDFALFPHLSVEKNIGFKIKNVEKISYWLNLLELNDVRDKKPEELSGGQKQRVALARTLVHEPIYVLLDEPLSSLDASLKDSLRWEIREALKTSQVSAIWVTHDQQEAMSVGDRLGILNQGELVQLERPETCYNDPTNRFVAHFLGEASFLPAMVDGAIGKTDIGDVELKPFDNDGKDKSILIRPWDCTIEIANDKNAEVEWVRYEGAIRTASLILDAKTKILVKTHSNCNLSEGDKIKVRLDKNKKYTVFSSQNAIAKNKLTNLRK